MIKKLANVLSKPVFSSDKIKVTCFGGAEEVTGSNFLLEYEGLKILIDCGLPQGLDSHHREWEPFNYFPKEVDYLLITHGHMDHIGRIPYLVNQGFNGKIVSTKPTLEIAHPALLDAYHILTKEMQRGNMERQPYEMPDIVRSFSIWKTLEYKNTLKINDKVSVTFFNSSHILGSASIQISCKINDEVKKFLFTGDMGNNSLLLKPPDLPTDSDIVFMETVYGARVHENLQNRREILKSIILDEISKKGNLIMPAFSIQRTQELLYEIHTMIESKEISKIPVYLDSPLSIEITKVFHHFNSLLSDKIQEHLKRGEDVFSFPGLHYCFTRDESIEINNIPGPKIIIAGSGMVQGGRVIHHVRKYIESAKNTILMAGYQAEGTYGRLLSTGKKEIVFYGDVLQVNAQIKNLPGYSAHRDSTSLLEFVGDIKGKCTSLNLILGDRDSLDGFQKLVKDKHNILAHICKKGEVIEF